MKYYEFSNNECVLGVGQGDCRDGDCNGVEISKARYDSIIAAIPRKPAATATTDYRLKTDLTWEQFEIDPPDPDPELDDSEAIEILLGGAV